MIQQKTSLKIVDNSGLKTGSCIKKKKNNMVLISIFEKKLKTNIKKGTLFSGIIIREKKLKTKRNGILFRFEENSIVLLKSKNGALIGNRFFGVIPSQLRKKNFLKILCLTLANI